LEANPDVNLLLDAFNTFKKASSTLENSYKVLEKRAEGLDLELKEKNNFLTSIMEGLPVGVLVTDDVGVIRSVNNSASQILSESETELIETGFEEKLRALDGSSAFDLSSIEKRPKSAGDEQITIKTNDETVKTITINATVLKNLQGERTGYLLVIRDISEIKRLRESSQRDKRLSAMGEMAASIAHQIRNPLGSIELFASLLNKELSGDEGNQKHAKEIVHAVRTLNNTLSNMLLFANTSTARLASVPLDEFILDIQGVTHFLTVEKPISFEVVNEATGLNVQMDRELMKQAILNLIINASDAVADSGDGVVTLLIRRDGDSKLCFSVHDTGPGISEGDLDKVFNPFYTSKASGTGLGLTVVSNIVNSHGGFIDLESESEKGTTFSITLPIGGIS
jgi:two-component system sensor histidine kinase FlrB